MSNQKMLRVGEIVFPKEIIPIRYPIQNDWLLKQTYEEHYTEREGYIQEYIFLCAYTHMHVTTTSEDIKDLEFERDQGRAYGIV